MWAMVQWNRQKNMGSPIIDVKTITYVSYQVLLDAVVSSRPVSSNKQLVKRLRLRLAAHGSS